MGTIADEAPVTLPCLGRKAFTAPSLRGTGCAEGQTTLDPETWCGAHQHRCCRQLRRPLRCVVRPRLSKERRGYSVDQWHCRRKNDRLDQCNRDIRGIAGLLRKPLTTSQSNQFVTATDLVGRSSEALRGTVLVSDGLSLPEGESRTIAETLLFLIGKSKARSPLQKSSQGRSPAHSGRWCAAPWPCRGFRSDGSSCGSGRDIGVGLGCANQVALGLDPRRALRSAVGAAQSETLRPVNYRWSRGPDSDDLVQAPCDGVLWSSTLENQIIRNFGRSGVNF